MSEDAPYLKVMDGPMKGTQFLLIGQAAVIGRGEGCDIRLEGVKGVSRQHAQVILVDNRLRVTDLGSQNGTTVDGKKISEATIPSGSIIKVGQASLKVFIPSSTGNVPAVQPDKRRARTASGRMVPAAAADQVPGTAGDMNADIAQADDGQGIDVQSIMLAAGEGSRGFLFFVIFLVVLMGGGLYIINASLANSRTTIPRYWIIKSGEERVIACHKPVANWKILSKAADESSFIAVSKYKGFLQDAVKRVNKRNGINGYPRLYFLVIRGVQQGDAAMLLQGKGKTEIGTVHVLVRGRVPHEWIKSMSPDVARDMAAQLVREADVLERDGQLYYALRNMRKASKLYRQAGESRLDNQVWKRYKRLEDKLQKSMEARFTEALALAFPDKNTGPKARLVTCYRQLEAVKRLAPDETSHDWQVVALWQAEIRKLLSRKK